MKFCSKIIPSHCQLIRLLIGYRCWDSPQWWRFVKPWNLPSRNVCRYLRLVTLTNIVQIFSKDGKKDFLFYKTENWNIIKVIIKKISKYLKVSLILIILNVRLNLKKIQKISIYLLQELIGFLSSGHIPVRANISAMIKGNFN